MQRLPLTLISAACFLIATSGCGGGSTNPTEPTPTSSPTQQPNTPPTTAQIQAAVNNNSESIAGAVATLEPLSYLSEADATRSHTGGENRPDVTITRNGENGITVTINYGIGITGPGNVTRSGVVTVAYDRSQRTGSMDFGNYRVNGRTVSGTVALTQLTITSDAVSTTGETDLTFGDGTHLQSNLSLSLTTIGIMMASGSLTVKPTGAAATSISLNGLTLNPSGAGDFISSSGTATMQSPYVTTGGVALTATIVITYTSDSSTTGVVLVSVNGGPQIPYTLQPIG